MQTRNRDHKVEHIFTRISMPTKLLLLRSLAIGSDPNKLLIQNVKKFAVPKKKDKTHGINTCARSGDLAWKTAIEPSRGAINTTISMVSPPAIGHKISNTYLIESLSVTTSRSQHANCCWKEGATKVDRVTRTTGRVAVRRQNILIVGWNEQMKVLFEVVEFEPLKREAYLFVLSLSYQ